MPIYEKIALMARDQIILNRKTKNYKLFAIILARTTNTISNQQKTF